MKLLLDTHVAVWAVVGSDRLKPRTLATIRDPDNVVGVSIISLWEIALKNNLGRAAAEPFGLSVAGAIAEFRAADFDVIAIDPAALDILETLPWLHRDPFDRLLIATAAANDWQFVTRDRQLSDYGPHVMAI